ncbi:MAG: MogA/MoaB family molybdenum cofactor biosynthesis protein [Planctomycetia bacterium]|nr:MogA/MoaB family molybdenum cofactor biosynthesis protein [Planctomycetia bacterium]
MIRAAILTLSDKGARGEREDKSGEVIRDMLTGIDATITAYEVIPDEKDLITKKLLEFAEKADLVVTTGGTGVGPRDVTPEATRAVIGKELPGFGEAMRREGLKHTPRAMGSRAIAGIYKQTLIVNLPGSPKGVAENLAVILPVIPHTIGLIKGKVSDCAKDREKHTEANPPKTNLF